MEVVLKMPFLSFSNIDIEFVRSGTFIWKFYDTAKILSTTNWVQLIDKHEFAKVAIEESSETFMIHVAALEIPATILPS